ncbi:MAG: hypothetical protein ACRC62_31515 [Microcoleus sp.]
MIRRYQQKTIEAVQYKYPATTEVRKWLGTAFGNEKKARHMNAKGELDILGTDGAAICTAIEGDYIVHGVRADGGFSCMNPTVFFQCWEERLKEQKEAIA